MSNVCLATSQDRACRARAWRRPEDLAHALALALKLTPTLRRTRRVTLVQQVIVDGPAVVVTSADRHNESWIVRELKGRQRKQGKFLTVTVCVGSPATRWTTDALERLVTCVNLCIQLSPLAHRV